MRIFRLDRCKEALKTIKIIIRIEDDLYETNYTY